MTDFPPTTTVNDYKRLYIFTQISQMTIVVQSAIEAASPPGIAHELKDAPEKLDK
jgi:hypothetical protein